MVSNITQILSIHIQKVFFVHSKLYIKVGSINIQHIITAFKGCIYQEPPGETTTRPIRTVTTAGVITDANRNDPGIIAAVAYANNLLWEDSDIRNLEYVISRAKSQVVSIRFKFQVVSGIKYYLEIEYTKQSLICDVEVTYQSWIDEYLFVSQACVYFHEHFTGIMV